MICAKQGTTGYFQMCIHAGFVKKTFKFSSDWLIYLVTFDTSGGIFLLIAASAIDFLFAWNKRFRSNRSFAYATRETFFMPLSGFVFHFLCAYLSKSRIKRKKDEWINKIWRLNVVRNQYFEYLGYWVIGLRLPYPFSCEELNKVYMFWAKFVITENF